MMSVSLLATLKALSSDRHLCAEDRCHLIEALLQPASYKTSERDPAVVQDVTTPSGMRMIRREWQHEVLSGTLASWSHAGGRAYLVVDDAGNLSVSHLYDADGKNSPSQAAQAPAAHTVGQRDNTMKPDVATAREAKASPTEESGRCPICWERCDDATMATCQHVGCRRTCEMCRGCCDRFRLPCCPFLCYRCLAKDSTVPSRGSIDVLLDNYRQLLPSIWPQVARAFAHICDDQGRLHPLDANEKARVK